MIPTWRRILAVAVVTLATGLAVRFAFNSVKRPLVDPATAFEQIRLSDSADHVESLLGLPPGDYRTDPVLRLQDCSGCYAGSDFPLSWKTWSFDEGEIVLVLARDGRIVRKELYAGVAPRSFLKRAWDKVESLRPVRPQVGAQGGSLDAAPAEFTAMEHLPRSWEEVWDRIRSLVALVAAMRKQLGAQEGFLDRAAVLLWRPCAARVRLGMTRAEVERLLAMPGEEYHVDHDPTGAAWRRRQYCFSNDPWEVVFVWYNPDQIVVGGCYHREPSLFSSDLARWVSVFGIRYDPVVHRLHPDAQPTFLEQLWQQIRSLVS